MKVFLRYFLLNFLLLFPSYDFLNAVQCPHCSDLRDDCLTPRTHGGGSTGKWNDNVTPKRGWTCIYAEDLGQGNTVECQMCEVEQVRYLHHMKHGDQSPLNLNVGCICSGHMEGRLDNPNFFENALAAAQSRTTNLQNRTARRNNFPNLSGWKTSKNNNPYIKKDGHLITIFPKNNGFSSVIKNIDSHESGFVPGIHATTLAAKLAAFDRLYPARIYVDQ